MNRDLPVAVIESGSCYLWATEPIAVTELKSWVGPQRLPGQATAIAGSGRGSAWRFDWQSNDLVLRCYRRGGLMARINRDLYLWQGPDRTRCAHEFQIMLELSASGLLVPEPVAAIACRVGLLFYRAALVTRWVNHQGSLATQCDEASWFAAGKAIAQMHQLGVWHADLNTHNVLIDSSSRAWLIDFDRARSGIHDQALLRQNLDRLLRSVRKVCPQQEKTMWSVLLRGYESLQKGCCV